MSFDRHARQYDAELEQGIRLSGEGREYFARGRIEAAAAFLEELGLRPDRIVDFGCGTGTNARQIQARWPQARVFGLDISAESLAVARARGASAGPSFLTPEEYRGAGAAPAAWVNLNGVLHHVPPAERADLLRGLHDLLRPGGALTAFENNPWNPGARWVMSRIPFDRDARMVGPAALRAMLRGAGLERVRSRHLFFFPRVLAALRPLERHLRRVPLGAQYGTFGVRRG